MMKIEEIEKRIGELERLTLKLLEESERTYKAAKEAQYEIKKLKDELTIEYDQYKIRLGLR